MGIIAALIFADGVVLGALVMLRYHPSPAPPAAERGHGAADWSQPTPTDLRIAAAFGALERDGLGAGLDALERAAATDSTVLRAGHQLAHTMGRMAVAASGGNASVIRECRPAFASGCFHGVVEASVQARGRVDMPELQRMCLAAGSAERPGPVHECMHGLGHGVLAATGFDLQAGLADCDGLAPAFAPLCYSGAFMEAINSALGASGLAGMGGGGGRGEGGAEHMHHGGMAHAMTASGPGAGSLTIDSNDPFSPCDRYADPYAAECWVFQGFLILRAQGFDAGRALEVCGRAPAPRSGDCYQSVGFQITGLFQRGDAWVIQQCGRGQAESAPRCAAGAARALVQIDWSGRQAVRFCAATPAAWKAGCYGTAARTLAGFASRPERDALCATVETAYAEGCRRAAALGAS